MALAGAPRRTFRPPGHGQPPEPAGAGSGSRRSSGWGHPATSSPPWPARW